MRPIKTWHVKRYNRDIQFTELLHHLFVTYDIPPFMDRVWLSDNETYHNWYKHIGAGQNIRTAPGIPITLTKKIAHNFLKAPKQYSIEEALIWGQIHALGGDKRLMEALRGTIVIRDFENNDFWLSVIRFFIANPMLDVSHVHPIIDFIQNQKFENQRVFVARGVVEERDPPQPNFSMKGRTPGTLLRNVNEWHRQLGRETKGGAFQWSRSIIGELRLEERSRESNKIRLEERSRKGNKTKYWIIRELLSTAELIDEGRSMNHCVISYAKSCYTGKTSIWAMESEEDSERRKVLTIELQLDEKLICQVRGKRNRLASAKEKSILTRWAAKEGLKIAEYVEFEGV